MFIPQRGACSENATSPVVPGEHDIVRDENNAVCVCDVMFPSLIITSLTTQVTEVVMREEKWLTNEKNYFPF